MILHFHAADALKGENAYLNVCFDKENYNFDIYPKSEYIEVDRKALEAIYQECYFNVYWHSDDLRADHGAEDATKTLYFAAEPDRLDEIMNDGIAPDESGFCILAQDESDAVQEAIAEHNLYYRDSFSLDLLTITAPACELWFPLVNDEPNLKGRKYFGIAGTIPVDWIDLTYKTIDLTSKECSAAPFS